MNVFIFIVGVVAGVILMKIASRVLKINTDAGKFMINRDDPHAPAFWLALDYDLDVLEKQRSVSFQVKFHKQ